MADAPQAYLSAGLSELVAMLFFGYFFCVNYSVHRRRDVADRLV
jgi:hypothetical protein